jgi:hypothetical protein
LLVVLLTNVSSFTPLRAQSSHPTTSAGASSSNTDESQERPPAFATGIGVGAMHYNGGRTTSGVAATLQYSPQTWLTFSATPGFGHTSLGATSSSGVTDMPLSVGASHSLGDLPLSPSLSGSLYTSLSFTDTTKALGVGRNTVGAAAYLSAWATDKLNLTAGGSHPVTANAGNGSIDLESAYSLGKTTANLGLSSEVGRADSGATLARSLAGGIAFAVRGPLTLTVDGSHGLTTGAPTWTFSVGFGTAFAGVSPLSASSALRRLKGVLGSNVSSTSSGKSGSGSCKRKGTC